MWITEERAKQLLNKHLEIYGHITIEGHIEDIDRSNGTGSEDYWYPEEIEAVVRLLELHKTLEEGNTSKTQLKVKRLRLDAVLPTRALDLDAGYDVYAVHNAVLEPGDRALVGTGIAIETPRGTFAQVSPRSGLAKDYGITVTNGPGTVDEGYRGEVKVNLINLGRDALVIAKGERIAQLIIQKYETPEVVEVDELSATDRGERGHGSTGQ